MYSLLSPNTHCTTRRLFCLHYLHHLDRKASFSWYSWWFLTEENTVSVNPPTLALRRLVLDPELWLVWAAGLCSFVCSVWHLCFAWFCLCCSLSSVTVDVFHLYWDRYSYRYFIFVLFIVKRKHKQVNRYNVSLATVTAYRFHIKVWYDTINNADVNDQTTCSRLFGLAPSLSCYGKISQVSSLTASYQNLYVFTKTCYLVILTHWSDFNQTPHL